MYYKYKNFSVITYRGFFLIRFDYASGLDNKIIFAPQNMHTAVHPTDFDVCNILVHIYTKNFTKMTLSASIVWRPTTNIESESSFGK